MTEIADPEPVLPSLLPWQTDRWEELVARRRSGRFPHALLLSGPQGIGKRQFAHRVAAALVCDATDPAAAPCGSCRSCRLVRSGTHPDIRWLTPEAEGKAIRVDAVRSLIDQSSLTTQAQGMRVFIVEPADAMNAAAANALLKTLEEPPASSCLLLVSSQPHRLPQTILSRCQRVSFRPVPPDRARQWLEAQATDAGGDQIESALAAAAGAPLSALQLLEGDEPAQLRQLTEDLCQLARRRVNPLAIARRWAEQPVLPQLARLRKVLFDLGRGLAAPDWRRRYLARSAGDLQSCANDINLQGIFEYLDEINRLEREMSHNLNPGMVTEKLVTDWLRLTRPGKD